MRTIQEKYNAILEGNFSKTQFLRDAKRELSQFLSPFNGYEDTVAILKNKRVLTEAKKEKATDYEPTPAGLPAEAISRGVDYELEAIGINTGVEMPTQDQLDKVTVKVHKNLAKNMNYYLDLIAGESKKVDKHDRPVEATKKNNVDTFNGMKKAELRESIVEKAMSKGYSKEQVEEALARLKEKKGKDHDGDGDIDSDDYTAAKDKAIKGAMKEAKVSYNFSEDELKRVLKLLGRNASTEVKMIKAFEKAFGRKLTRDEMFESVNEGRRKKVKGGKMVQEADYNTGGYVESMGPLFERACDMLAKAFGEWAKGPMTEPGMIAPAKEDVVRYLDQKLTSQFLEEDNSDSINPGNTKDDQSKKDDYDYDSRPSHMREAAKDKKKGTDTVRDEQLKEAMKGIIANILTEGVITEAATGNLSKIADTYNDYEGMQAAVNALENIVTDVESYNSKTRDKIQKIYDSLKDIKNKDGLVVGSFIAPAIAQAFSKDLIPVSDKGFTSNLALPKTNIIKAGDVQEEELDEKETVFSPVTEITAAQQKYVDKAASKPSKPVKTQFRKDIEAAKRAIDSGRLTDQQIIKKYGIEAFNAVNAENEYNEGVTESKKRKYTKK